MSGVPDHSYGGSGCRREVRLEDLTASERCKIGLAGQLNNGLVLVHPTDTVYGLLADLNDDDAYRNIYALKGRDFANPLALLVGNGGSVYAAALDFIRSRGVQDDFAGGDLTAIIPPEALPDDIAAQISRIQPGAVGLRCPAHAGLQELLSEMDSTPLWATSVNRSGDPPATTVRHVREWRAGLEPEQEQMLGTVVLTGAPMRGVPSRVVDLTGDAPLVLR